MSSSHRYISNDEYRRLQQGGVRLSQAQEEMRQIQARAAQRERDIQSQYQANITTLQSSMNAMSQQHNADMRRVSQEFRNNIANQTADFQQRLSRQREQNRQDINALEERVGQSIGQIRENMRDIDNRVTAVASDFSNRFNELARAQANEQAYAEASIIEMNDLLNTIHGLQPNKFIPGEYEALNEQLSRARNVFALQQYGSALAITQVNMTDAARLLHRLSSLNTLFNEMLINTREHANELNQRISSMEGPPMRFM